MGFTGCAKQEVLAAKVGDREITLTQLENSYTNSSAYASYSGYSLDTDEGIAKYVDYLLDNLIAQQHEDLSGEALGNHADGRGDCHGKRNREREL